jgi:Fur family ferric uptake transcriptional regulator
MKDELKGYISRMTAPREGILEFLSRSKKHMSAKEIYISIQKKHPGIGLSTVYRTLNLLARMGLVTKLTLGDGQSRYEFKSKAIDEHHHHLICIKCGLIVNYSEFLEEELALVRRSEKRLAKKYDFVIQDHNIEFLGICKKCR